MGSLSQEHGPSRFLDTHLSHICWWWMSFLGYQHKDMSWLYLINPRLQPRLQRFLFFFWFQKAQVTFAIKKKIPRSLGILCTYWTMEWEHPYHARGSRWVVAEKFQFPTVLPRQPTPKKSPMGAASSDFVDPETLPLQILLAEEAHQRAFWCWLFGWKGIQVQLRD